MLVRDSSWKKQGVRKRAYHSSNTLYGKDFKNTQLSWHGHTEYLMQFGILATITWSQRREKYQLGEEKPFDSDGNEENWFPVPS